MDFGHDGESKEKIVAGLMQQLENYFEDCVLGGFDISFKTAMLWNASQDTKNPNLPQNLMGELYEADPENFDRNVNKFMEKIRAGAGLRALLDNWVMATLRGKLPPFKNPELN